MSELFVGMLSLSVTVGLPWKSHTTRIACGLGIYSGICVLIETTKSVVRNGALTSGNSIDPSKNGSISFVPRILDCDALEGRTTAKGSAAAHARRP